MLGRSSRFYKSGKRGVYFVVVGRGIYFGEVGMGIYLGSQQQSKFFCQGKLMNYMHLMYTLFLMGSKVLKRSF